jgi:hypothetical protein
MTEFLRIKQTTRGQEGEMTQGNQNQGQQQSPAQMLTRALSEIRRVQNLLELNYPNQADAIKMQREAGDLIWQIIQGMQQQQQQQGQQ